MDLAKVIVKKPEVQDARHYGQRIRLLAGIYLGLFFISFAGCVLLVWKGRLYVTLTQRSNVETLTLAFFLVLFGYLVLLSWKGALGAIRIVWHRLRRLRVDPLERERGKAGALRPPRHDTPPAVAVNQLLEHNDRPYEPFEICVADPAGSVPEVTADYPPA